MAAACWVYTTINRMMVSAVGRALERRHGRAQRVGKDVYPPFRGVDQSNEEIKIEGATGP